MPFQFRKRAAAALVALIGCFAWPAATLAVDLSAPIANTAVKDGTGAPDHNPGGGPANRIAGVWTSYFINPLGVPVYSLYTINADGTSEGNNNIDQGDNFSGAIYSNIRGSWVRTGPRSIREVAWNFAFNTNGVHTQTIKYITDYEFDAKFTHADALSTFEGYAPSASMVDPDAEPLWVFPDVPGTLDKWELEPPGANNGRGIFKKAAGVWYIPPGEAFDAWVIFTINADGTLEENSTLDEGGNPGMKVWSNGRGPLVKTDDQTFYGSSVILGFDLATGVHDLNVKGEVTYALNQTNDTCDIVQVNKVYLATQNPLDPDEIPIFTTDELLSTAYKWIVEPPAPPDASEPLGEPQTTEGLPSSPVEFHRGLARSGGLGRPLIPRVAGTWYSDELFCLGTTGLCEQLLLTLNADGTIEGNSTSDRGVLWGGGLDLNSVYSNGRGPWMQIGPLTTYEANVFFAFDRTTGAHTGTTVADVFYIFDPGLQTGTIRQVNKVYGPDQNVFDPDAEPILVRPEVIYPMYRLSAE